MSRDCDNPRPPSLPRIFDHRKYAEAARQDHDDRARTAETFYRASRRYPKEAAGSARATVGIVVGFALLGLAIFVAIINITTG